MLVLLSYLFTAAVGAALTAVFVLNRRRSLRAKQWALPKQSVAELQRFRAAVDTCVDSIYMVDRETLKFVDATASASSRTG